jgi:ribosomal protein L11 methyltransferase
MHNPKKSCKLLKFSPVEELPSAEADFLDEMFDVVSVDFTDDGLEQYVCYAPLDFDIEAFQQDLNKTSLHFPPFTVEELEDKNWLTANVIKFAPFEIGAFLIYGIHESQCPKTDKIPVQVYAATAFGSEHQTTKMCLQTLSDLKDTLTPQKILDMGTGSGILSIAAAKLWNLSPKIIAADIDPESVDVTASNAITNGVETVMQSILSDGYQNTVIKDNAPYDLILANILANPLKEMSHSAYTSLRPGGYYLISGFIDNQEEDILRHHQALGFKLIKTCKMENWRAALLQK